jgi:hypothetical protein
MLVLAFELGERTVSSATRSLRNGQHDECRAAIPANCGWPGPLSLSDWKHLGRPRGLRTTRQDLRLQRTGCCAPLQPSRIRGAARDARVWRPRRRTHLHVPSRTPERFAAPVVQAAHAAHLCVPKKGENLRAALVLHFAYYNFCCVHSSINMTLAQAAGIAGRPLHSGGTGRVT